MNNPVNFLDPNGFDIAAAQEMLDSCVGGLQFAYSSSMSYDPPVEVSVVFVEDVNTHSRSQLPPKAGSFGKGTLDSSAMSKTEKVVAGGHTHPEHKGIDGKTLNERYGFSGGDVLTACRLFAVGQGGKFQFARDAKQTWAMEINDGKKASEFSSSKTYKEVDTMIEARVAADQSDLSDPDKYFNAVFGLMQDLGVSLYKTNDAAQTQLVEVQSQNAEQ